MKFFLQLLAISSLVCGSGALAMPHSIIIPSALNKKAGACTFPDGTSPAGNSEIHCYEPKTFLQAYGIDKLHAAGLTGKGQTVILVDSFGSPTLQADLDHFSDTFRIKRTTIQFVYPNGKFVNDLSTEDKVGWAGETTLDLEWAHAIAPDATLVNVVSNTAETVGLEGFPDLMKGIEMAIAKYPGAIVSMSYGTGEPTFTPNDISQFLKGSYHSIFAKAIAADMTLLASSGDSGSTNLDALQKNLIATPNASYPASDSLVTAVGGTSLQMGWIWNPQGTAADYWTCKLNKTPNCNDFLSSSASSVRTETVWKEDFNFAAGGAGVSSIFGLPEYQKNVNNAALAQMRGQRAIPDISMNAAINGGVDIYTSYKSVKFGVKGPSWQSTGGTSCASPEMAALVALAGQKASDTLGKKVGVGSLNEILYSLPASDFNDITSVKLGTSQQVMIDNEALFYSAGTFAAYPKNAPPTAVAGYYTAPGFDIATGLGSPKAERLVLDIAKARVAREARPLP